MKKIQLPLTLLRWFGKSVVLTPTPHSSLLVYTEESFRDCTEKLRKSLEQQGGTTYDQFYSFMKDSSQTGKISILGTLTLPERVQERTSLEANNCEIRRIQFGLEITSEHLENQPS